ncbi:MAG: hypothetical protein ACRENJ_01695 [Candidatus Eiseniibacteriota bacterium]
MERIAPRLGLIALGLFLSTMPGCGDPVNRLLANEALRTQLWDTVAGSPELSGQVVDRLLAADSTRALLLDRLLASGGARQALLMRVATDHSLMEGTIHFAVQDTTMRDHLKTLFRGMEMERAGAATP